MAMKLVQWIIPTKDGARCRLVPETASAASLPDGREAERLDITLASPWLPFTFVAARLVGEPVSEWALQSPCRMGCVPRDSTGEAVLSEESNDVEAMVQLGELLSVVTELVTGLGLAPVSAGRGASPAELEIVFETAATAALDAVLITLAAAFETVMRARGLHARGIWIEDGAGTRRVLGESALTLVAS